MAASRSREDPEAWGGPGDQCVFHTLRAVTDVVLVGAGTMRTEGHGPVRLDQAQRVCCAEG